MIKSPNERLKAAKYLAAKWYSKDNLDDLNDEQFELVTRTVATAETFGTLKKFTEIDPG